MMLLRPHRALVSIVLTVAMLATIGAAGARWLDVQILNVHGWTQTSGRLVSDREVRRAITDFSVDRVFGQAGIDSAIDDALPGVLATHAKSTLHHVADGASAALLATAAGRRSWRRANHQAIAGLLAAVDHGRANQGLVLDLSPLLRDVVSSVAGSTVAAAIPGSSRLLTLHSTDAGRLVVLNASQVDSLRTVVRTIRTLAWALPLLAAALFLLALILAQGWRFAAFSGVGYRLLIAAGAILALRVVAQHLVAVAFVASSVDRAGIRAGWMIATSTLRAEAISLLVSGAFITAGSWLLRVVARGSGVAR